MRRILSACSLALLSALCACSVKEKRCDCPCYLLVDFSGVDAEAVDTSYLDVSDAEGFLYHSEIASGDYQKEIVIEVPRKLISVCAVAGGRDVLTPGKGVLIPEGEDCPLLYMHHSVVDAGHDSAVDTVRFHKAYCAVTVAMLSSEVADELGFRICGNVCGYDRNGMPLGGPFVSSGTVLPDGRHVVNIPRQCDSSLRLRIVDDDMVVREFALGEYMASGGYDWGAEDLEDVDVTIDFALAAVTLKVENWETRYVYDVEI